MVFGSSPSVFSLTSQGLDFLPPFLCMSVVGEVLSRAVCSQGIRFFQVRSVPEHAEPEAWPSSCYATKRDGPNDLEGDFSREEARWAQLQVRPGKPTIVCIPLSLHHLERAPCSTPDTEQCYSKCHIAWMFVGGGGGGGGVGGHTLRLALFMSTPDQALN